MKLSFQTEKAILYFSVFILWLFHASAVIGITLGYQDWFISKTPLNLLLGLVLLIINFPLLSRKLLILTFFFFCMGMLAEWVGVHFGFLFGIYSYGATLGPKFSGVPYLIGVNWAVLILITGAVANALVKSQLARVFLGALLMVSLDFFMESAAPIFDFWTFDGLVAPLKNYVAWFGIAFILHGVFQRYKVQGNSFFSTHFLLCQFFFFIFFYVFYRI